MTWSRYNLLFESKRNDWLLYNSISNNLMQLNGKAANALMYIRDGSNTVSNENHDLYFNLRFGGFLVEDGKDDASFQILKMKRLAQNYADKVLDLTIALTKECNFECHYCYNCSRAPSKISEDTQLEIIEFVKKSKITDAVTITWIGGEPLLEFETMKLMTKRITEVGLKYDSFLITNGYCLTPYVIKDLGLLKISAIQITIDGVKEIHDSRRTLIGGGNTYDVIISNIDKLMISNWTGTLKIRVNIDKQTIHAYAEIYKLLCDKYPGEIGKRLTIFPGFIHDSTSPENEMFLNPEEQGRFVIDTYYTHNIVSMPVFPLKPVLNSCLMSKKNAFMVGPDGELYKCWTDLGKSDEVVGSINGSVKWNMALLAESMVGASYLDDVKCINCLFFPLCNGGCPKVRMLNKREDVKRNVCSYFKIHACDLLELHYEQKKKLVK